MKVQTYRERIGHEGALEADANTLTALHRAHMEHVPFENLDIARGRPITLQSELLFEKIVARKRGGFCYEVNGLFAELLRAVGFEVTMLSARVAQGEGAFGPEFDHLTLHVRCPADPDPHIAWLADVGFGDSFTAPLRLVADQQPQGLRAYRLESVAPDAYLLWQKEYDGSWAEQYRFTLAPHPLSDFAEMCHYHQTSPESPFTRKRIISRATLHGRISLDPNRLIVTEDGARQEFPVTDAAAYDALLWQHFGVRLD